MSNEHSDLTSLANGYYFGELRGMEARVHQTPRIFAAPPEHATASGFDSIEYMSEIFLNLINV